MISRKEKEILPYCLHLLRLVIIQMNYLIERHSENLDLTYQLKGIYTLLDYQIQISPVVCNRELGESKELLHKILARGLGVPCNPKTGHIDLLDDMQYVMTLDFAVKMLTIHERRLCGIPVVIKGETGVGKTFLLKMLSALWNQVLLASLEHEREELKDYLKRDLNSCLTAILDEKQKKDLMEALKIIGEKKIPIPTIILIFETMADNKNSLFLVRLLSRKTKLIFSILELPDHLKEYKYGTLSQLFSTAEKPRKEIKEV